jgi:hypothetical protein
LDDEINYLSDCCKIRFFAAHDDAKR